MNTVDSCMLLSGSGYMSSILFGIGGTLNVKWGHNKEAVVSSILMVLCSGMSVAGITIEGHIVDNRTQEIINYISSLSTEELETLSEDLVSADISDSYIEVELSDRIDTLSENSDLFNSDEERDLLQESVAGIPGNEVQHQLRTKSCRADEGKIRRSQGNLFLKKFKKGVFYLEKAKFKVVNKFHLNDYAVKRLEKQYNNLLIRAKSEEEKAKITSWYKCSLMLIKKSFIILLKQHFQCAVKLF